MEYKELVHSLKHFIEWVLISSNLSEIYNRQWSVISHFLNIYPNQTDKLHYYTQICGDHEQEEKFINSNCLCNIISKK